MAGYVYIFSNKAMPGLYKIGCTGRSPRLRADELYSTGVPYPFTIEYYAEVDNYHSIESKTHLELRDYNTSKEWFKCNLDKCILAIRKSCSNNTVYGEYYKNTIVKNQVYNEEEVRLKQESIRIKQERINNINKIKEENKYQAFKQKQLKKAANAGRIYSIIWGSIVIAVSIDLGLDSKNLTVPIIFGIVGLIVLVIGLCMNDESYFSMRGSMSREGFEKYTRKQYEKMRYR